MRNQTAAKKHVHVKKKILENELYIKKKSIFNFSILFRLLADTMPSSTLYLPWKWIANQEPRKSSQLLGSFPPFWRHPIVSAGRNLSPSPASLARWPGSFARTALTSWTVTRGISGGSFSSFCLLWCISFLWPSLLWRVQKLPFAWPGLSLLEIPPHTSRIPPLKDVTKSIRER